MQVTLTHPTSGFTGVITVRETVVLSFTNGTASEDVPPSAFGAILDLGILINAATGSNPPYDANLDAVMAPIVQSTNSSTSGALRAAFAPLGSPAAALLMQKLTLGITSEVVQVVGDSTGVVGDSPWPLVLARWLAAQFPAYTVNYRVFSDANQAYYALGAATTYPSGVEPKTGSQVIQTGTGTGNAGGPFVLDIYNGSVSGSSFSYPMASTTRWGKIFSVTPTLVFVNYGHNSNGSTTFYRYQHYQLCRTIEEAFPYAGIIQVAQNPRAATDAEMSNDLYRARTVMELAGTEGYGLVNVTEAFLADPNYAADLMLGDGLHPNDTAGSPLWAQEVEKHLSASRNVIPRQPSRRVTRMWIPASTFSLASGTASLAMTNSENFMWSMPHGSDSAIVASLDLPSFWGSYDSYLIFSTATASGYTGSNNVARVRTATAVQGLGFSSTQLDNSVVSTGSWVNNQASPINATAHNNAAYSLFANQLQTDSPPVSRSFGYRVTRVGTDAADTLNEPIYVRGVVLYRAR